MHLSSVLIFYVVIYLSIYLFSSKNRTAFLRSGACAVVAKVRQWALDKYVQQATNINFMPEYWLGMGHEFNHVTATQAEKLKLTTTNCILYVQLEPISETKLFF